MQSLQPLLTYPPIDRIRRNHGLEHATIHLLSRKRRVSVVGRSDLSGFVLMGDLSEEEIIESALEALARMKSGERDLAIHPTCGTNFVTSAAFAALAAFVGFFGARSFSARLSRIPLVFALITGSLILAQPVGMSLQANVTTSGDMRDMEIISVKKVSDFPALTHRVETRG